MPIWHLLLFARFKQISQSQVSGDLKIIIDWFNKNNLHVASLEGWQQRIILLGFEFSRLDVKHAFGESIIVAYMISKHDLSLDEGNTLYFMPREKWEYLGG